MLDRPNAEKEPSVVRQNVTPMPQAIGKAILEAISKISGAQATGKGEDAGTARSFRYASINDVLDAAHQVMCEVGLAAIPIEVEYRDEIVSTPLNTQMLAASYAYKFRLVTKDGTSWVDQEDTRHVSLLLPVDGQGAGKAQSLATRDYLKGLLRIRTVEPEDAAQNGVEKQPRETERIPPKDTLLFDFGDGMEALTYQEVETKFGELISGLKFAQRKQWETANGTGLRQLNEVARPLWLRIRADLDREDRKRS